MFPVDWRSPATYEPMQNLATVGFAWEYLRRNPDYRRDHREITRTSTRPLAFGIPLRDPSPPF